MQANQTPPQESAETELSTTDGQTTTIEALPSLLPSANDKSSILNVALPDRTGWSNTTVTGENPRFTQTLRTLEKSYNLSKRHSLSLTTAYHSMFALTSCTEDELTNCEGVGPTIYDQLQTNPPEQVPPLLEYPEPPLYHPEGWTATIVSEPPQTVVNWQSTWKRLILQHDTSNTTVCLSKTDTNTFVPILSPTNAPRDVGIALNYPGMDAPTAFKALDLILEATPQRGYKLDQNCSKLGNYFGTNITLRDPRSHSTNRNTEKNHIASSSQI